tara:strand:- start:2162 stop:2362 length:201 start_codon:yes stop_codon:yes gene_type:complete
MIYFHNNVFFQIGYNRVKSKMNSIHFILLIAKNKMNKKDLFIKHYLSIIGKNGEIVTTNPNVWSDR